MKRIFRCTALLGAGLFLLTGCGGGSATLLGEPEAMQPLTYTEYDAQGEDFHALAAAAEDFAARLAPYAVRLIPEGNAVLSPVSTFSALALAAQCASGETASELYAALGVSEGVLDANFANFIRSLLSERKEGRKVTSELAIGNSIWLSEGASAKDECIRTLSEKYLCYSYAADFLNDNAGANKSIRAFLKDQTHGLIDSNPQLPESTLFTLITTLYLKDTWTLYGDELPLTKEQYPFNGMERQLMQGFYEAGRAYEGETFRTFFAETYHGYRLHFLVPEDGVAVEDIFTEQTLSALRGMDYRADDEAAKIHYKTRCLFPNFEGKFDADLKGALGELGIGRLFADPARSDGCTLTALTDSPAYCTQVRHMTSLTVDRRGIEGAAVVLLPMAGESGPDGWETVYEDFVVDRSFGFVLSDRRGTTLFSGIIREA